MSTQTPRPTSLSSGSVPQPRADSDGHPGAGSAAPSTRSRVPGADYRRTFFWRVFGKVAQTVDHRVGWDKLPLPGGSPS
ncbi:hypothetical protein [Blastococcus sp. PRF04-17]|uniref:hypothetical protein n=1 Tax=Blastococcus sp. PRF04-17 TaxID=2933797 RepID=UPI001FF4E536|nr:hypothetical protein [Blastococcus sp. PRF04-17]UOY03677.1 hypothetical protein MVA48_10240 [Blastococcus sp. PRF04-17]